MKTQRIQTFSLILSMAYTTGILTPQAMWANFDGHCAFFHVRLTAKPNSYILLLCLNSTPRSLSCAKREHRIRRCSSHLWDKTWISEAQWTSAGCLLTRTLGSASSAIKQLCPECNVNIQATFWEALNDNSEKFKSEKLEIYNSNRFTPGGPFQVLKSKSRNVRRPGFHSRCHTIVHVHLALGNKEMETPYHTASANSKENTENTCQYVTQIYIYFWPSYTGPILVIVHENPDFTCFFWPMRQNGRVLKNSNLPCLRLEDVSWR